LLSLAWGEAWQVRVAPAQARSIPPQLPDPLRTPERWPPTRDNAQVGLRHPVVLPPWFVSAWDGLARGAVSREGADALAVWHQGVLLMPQHPSFAFVAFVSSIEAAAASRELGLAPGSAQERFWSAMATVADQREIDFFRARKVYGRLRSATMHGGVLHGIEKQFGAPLFMPINPDDPMQEFMFETLQRMARTSRRVVIRVLRGDPWAPGSM